MVSAESLARVLMYPFGTRAAAPGRLVDAPVVYGLQALLPRSLSAELPCDSSRPVHHPLPIW